MIIKFNIFEKITLKVPKIGDFVLLKFGDDIFSYTGYHTAGEVQIMSKFINNSIGEIVNKSNVSVEVKYSDISFQIAHLFKNKCIIVLISTILEFGETVEELHMKFNANKYNL